MSGQAAFDELSRHELLAHVEQLQRKLGVITLQRDELSRDVELLCMNSGSATFDSSSVLQERVRSAETELHRLKKDYAAVCIERDELKEDHVHLKEAKRVSDRSCREAAAKNAQLARDLEFYQKQAAEAMQARDRAQGDADQLREHNAQLDATVTRRDVELTAERNEAADLGRRLAAQGEEIAELQARAEVAARVPGLQRELAARGGELARVTSERDQLQADIAEQTKRLQTRDEDVVCIERQLEALQAERLQLRADLESAQRALAEQTGKATMEREALQAELTQAKAHIIELESTLAGTQATCTKAEAELASVRQQMKTESAKVVAEVRRQLDSERQAAQALREEAAAASALQAELRSELERARVTEALTSERLEDTKATLQDLEVKLQQVAQEKMRLLIENADIKEQLRDTTTIDREDEDAWVAWPWKPSYGRGKQGEQTQGSGQGLQVPKARRPNGHDGAAAASPVQS